MVVAAYVKQLTCERAPQTVKQHLAAIRMLFDWLVIGHVVPSNPASSVRGPRYSVRKGRCSPRRTREGCSTASRRVMSSASETER